MTMELRKSLDELRTLSPQLNKATDDANRVVQLVEKFLNDECRIGLRSYVTIWTDKPDHEQYLGIDDFAGLLLGYDRCGSAGFRIVIQRNEDKEESEGNKYIAKDIRPWAESARGDKLKSFPGIPQLLKKIVAEAEQAIASASKTSKAIDEMMAALAPEKKPAPMEYTPGMACAEREMESLLEERNSIAIKKPAKA